MKAAAGDRLVVEHAHLGERRRVGITVEITVGITVGLRHEDGSPPHLARWLDEDHETLVFPGPDARVEHREHAHHG